MFFLLIFQLTPVFDILISVSNLYLNPFFASEYLEKGCYEQKFIQITNIFICMFISL